MYGRSCMHAHAYNGSLSQLFFTVLSVTALYTQYTHFHIHTRTTIFLLPHKEVLPLHQELIDSVWHMREKFLYGLHSPTLTSSIEFYIQRVKVTINLTTVAVKYVH